MQLNTQLHLYALCDEREAQARAAQADITRDNGCGYVPRPINLFERLKDHERLQQAFKAHGEVRS